MYNLISFAGIFILMAFAGMFSTNSTNRKVINWRVVIWGILLQLIFAMFIFIEPAGSKIFLLINDAVVKVLDCATAGTRFLFGRLALPPGMKNEAGEESIGFILTFQALPTIIEAIIKGANEGVKMVVRAVLTEVKAYQDLAVLFSSDALKNPRSAVLAAYALCGFAHVASLAIFIGGTAALIPERTRDLSAVGIRALIHSSHPCYPYDSGSCRDLLHRRLYTPGQVSLLML